MSAPCVFANQDDSIAIKAGKVTSKQPRRQRACENILVRDCQFDGTLVPGAHPLGIGIGSETSGGVRNVWVRDCEFNEVASIINIKANRERLHGLVENVRVERCHYRNTRVSEKKWNRAPISVDLFYYGTTDPSEAEPLSTSTPLFRDFVFKDITIENPAGRFIYLCGLAEQPLRDLVFENVTGLSRSGLYGHHVVGLRLRNVAVEVREGPPFVWHSVQLLAEEPSAPVE